MTTTAVALMRPRAVRTPIVMRIPRAHFRPRPAESWRARAPWGCHSTGPQWGSAIDVLDRLLATGRLALHPVTQKIGKDHVVPAAGWANFDDHDLELPELVCHLFQFSGPLDPTGVLTQLVSEHVVQVDQALRLTDRAIDVRRLAMVLGRPDQHRVSVTDLLPSERTTRTPERLEDGTSLQRVVDNLALGPHGQQRTWTRAARRPAGIFRGIRRRASLKSSLQARSGEGPEALGFRLSMQQIGLARMVVVGSRRFVAGFGAGSSGSDGVPVLAAVKPWASGCGRWGGLTAAARRRLWLVMEEPRGGRPPAGHRARFQRSGSCAVGGFPAPQPVSAAP